MKALAMGMDAEQGAGVPVAGAGPTDLTTARGLLRRGAQPTVSSTER